MKLITKESVAATAAERWKDQYCHKGEWSTVCLKSGETSAKNVYERLVALGPAPSGEAIAEVIGNDGWGRAPRCDECGQYGHDVVLQVGEEPDYESATANLCMNCVSKAAAAIGVMPVA